MSREFALEVTDAAFEEFGDPATYTPPAGAAVPVVVRLAEDDDVGIGFGERGPIGRGSVIKVRAADLTPAAGGAFEVGGTVYTIQGAPLCEDRYRLVWTCKVEAS